MKRVLSVFVIFVLLLSITGCSLIPGLDTIKGVTGLFSENGESSPVPEDTLPVEDQQNTTDPNMETEAVPEEPEQTEPEDGSVFIDLDTQYKINLFLSNFAEAGIAQYPCCNYHKLRFVMSHCQINGVGDPEYANDYVYISQNTAESVLNKYTGAAIAEDGVHANHEDCMGSGAFISFNENFYACPASLVETYAYAAVVDAMSQNDDGTYTVSYRVYELDSRYSIYDYSSIYKYTPAEALYDWNLTVVYSAEAVVKDYVRSNGQESYQLISLKTV